jgi:hypothetical protein
MKRSAMGGENTLTPNYVHNINQQNLNNNQIYSPNHQVLNFNTTPRHRDVPQKMSLNNIPSFQTTN